MLITQKNIPTEYTKWSNQITALTEKYPFYVKEYGFCNEKKLEIGQDRSYNDILILYSFSGVVRYSKHTSTKFIQPHHVIISACNTPLYFTKSSSKWEFFYIIIAGSHTKLFYNMIRTKSDVLTINPLSSLLSYFIDLVKMVPDDDDKTNMDFSLLIHEILHELYEVTYDIGIAKLHTPVQKTDVNTALSYIANHYKEDLTIDNICKEVNLSKYYFCKIFTKHMGVSIHKYLVEYRVNKSKELLTYSKLSINSIASEVGFNNSLTYIRCFKNSMHMTPSEYRENF